MTAALFVLVVGAVILALAVDLAALLGWLRARWHAEGAKRPKRLRRGRPPRDYSDDPDVEVAEWAIALQAAWGLSARRAFDFALEICQGVPVRPSKNAARGQGEEAVGRPRAADGENFCQPEPDIRRKLKNGKLHPNAEVVLHIARVLHWIRGIKT